MNDNRNGYRAPGYEEFITDLCEAILARVTELGLSAYAVRQLGVGNVHRLDIMRLRDRELHQYWSFHRIARLAEALGIRVEFSFRFDEEMKRAA